MRLITRAEPDVSQPNSAWLALDIGGAHLKAAHSQAGPRTTAFEVWRMPGELAQAITDLAAGFPDFDRVAVTTTAELCDCFETKSVGVRAILDARAGGIAEQLAELKALRGKNRDVVEHMMQRVRDARPLLDRLITHRFPMSEVASAFALQESCNCGKVLLYPGLDAPH